MILPLEFVRSVDDRGRLTIPAEMAGRFPQAARVSLHPKGLVLVEPAARGRRVYRPNGHSRTRRVIIPPEIRQRTGIRPGADVGIAATARGVWVWALPAAGRAGR